MTDADMQLIDADPRDPFDFFPAPTNGSSSPATAGTPRATGSMCSCPTTASPPRAVGAPSATLAEASGAHAEHHTETSRESRPVHLDQEDALPASELQAAVSDVQRGDGAAAALAVA